MQASIRLVAGISIVALSLVIFGVACGDDGDEEPSPTSTSSAMTPTFAATTVATETPPTTGTPAETEEPFSGGRDPVEGQAQGSAGAPVLTEVRTGAHTDYDRIAFEFEGDERPHYRVEYITPPATGCASGEPATVAGTAVLRVQFQPANAHNETGASTIDANELTPGLATLLEAESTCDFEADVQWALGLTEEVDFRVLELDSPPRIAVDVAHP
jgi:hypothetical protein